MTLAISTCGAGPDLVLIHGWAMHGGIFAPLVDVLATHWRVHLVDLPGHGRSREAWTPGALDPATCAARIIAATPPAIWLGWSLGGLVAVHAALADPRHVRGLIAIASSPRFVAAADWPHGVAASVFAEFGAALESRFEHAIERFLALETLGSPHAHEELRALRAQVFAPGAPRIEALREGLALLDAVDLRATRAELRVPSLWIGGRRDRLVPPGALAWAAQHAPRARLLELPSGHAPFLAHAAPIATAIGALAAELGP